MTNLEYVAALDVVWVLGCVVGIGVSSLVASLMSLPGCGASSGLLHAYGVVVYINHYLAEQKIYFELTMQFAIRNKNLF